MTVRVGIIGKNYGYTVLAPAFQLDHRCVVVANARAGWRDIIKDPSIDAVAVAVPPIAQPTIAQEAIAHGKAVFLEKPLAVSCSAADPLFRAPAVVTMDFNFTEVLAFKKVKELLDSGYIGQLTHVGVNWQGETYAVRQRIEGWKTTGEGGGVLGNFASHVFHYLEWFCGSITGVSARLSGLTGEQASWETTLSATVEFVTGAVGNVFISCASFLGSGHRLEFYGTEGTLILYNSTKDYMRGFWVLGGQIPSAFAHIPIPVGVDAAQECHPDGRVGPVSRVASRFIDKVLGKTDTTLDLFEGYRVQKILDAARWSNQHGCWRVCS